MSMLNLHKYTNICHKNVDIKLSVHNTILEHPSSGTLKVERLESQIILKALRASKPKGLKWFKRRIHDCSIHVVTDSIFQIHSVWHDMISSFHLPTILVDFSKVDTEHISILCMITYKIFDSLNGLTISSFIQMYVYRPFVQSWFDSKIVFFIRIIFLMIDTKATERTKLWFMVFNITFNNIHVYHGGQFYWWRKPEYPKL